MSESLGYELLDFGGGRRLERFGTQVLDRPCPACEDVGRAAPQLWAAADACYELAGDRTCRSGVSPLEKCGETPLLRGSWTFRGEPPSTWTLARGGLVFEMKRTDFGHVGLFPEQAGNWDWLAEQIAHCNQRLGRAPKLLNLFAYTGGATLAAAAAGAEVVHVDAARNMTAWARRNAALSGLADSPIRWIAEDALKFVRREIRRGNRYDAIVLDPPSYGHGPHGESWQLDRCLPELLALCAELLSPSPQLILLTCHTPDYTPGRLRELLAAAFSSYLSSDIIIEAEDLVLRTAASRALPCGASIRLSGR